MAHPIVLDIIEEEDVNLDIEQDEEAEVEAQDIVEVTTSDYRKLNNKPTINGSYPEYVQELVENYDEVDPTVPEWAKEEEPREISETHIEFVWKSIFG